MSLMNKAAQIASDRSHDDTKTVLPMEMARGVFMQNAPSLRALKLMHLMISKAGGKMGDDIQHSMRLSEVRAIEGMAHHDQESLKPLFTELRAATMVYDEPDKQRWTVGDLLDIGRVDYRHEVSGDVLVSWYFSRMFTEMARNSNHWAILDRQTVFSLGSKYSVLLFQHIASLVNLKHIHSKIFTVPELRALFGVPAGKMARFADLNRRAIQPAIDEINQLSRFTLTAKTHKIGRTVASVEIFWEVKEDHSEVKKEMERPKVGRKARRDGAVEQVAEGFPSSGRVYGRWEEIARLHAPKIDGQHIPDLSALSDAFRRWAGEKDIPLDGANIAKTFTGFCKKYRPTS